MELIDEKPTPIDTLLAKLPDILKSYSNELKVALMKILNRGRGFVLLFLIFLQDQQIILRQVMLGKFVHAALDKEFCTKSAELISNLSIGVPESPSKKTGDEVKCFGRTTYLDQLIFLSLIPEDHHSEYSPTAGQTLMYLIPKSFNLDSKWTLNLLRSCLSMDFKRSVLANDHQGIGRKNEHKLTVHALGLSCPALDVKAIMTAVGADFANSEIFARKGNQYGIHLVSRTQQVYDRLKNDPNCSVLLLSLREQYTNANISDESLYHKITDSLKSSVHCVYLRGLGTISDSLLKRLAEFTCTVCPWAYIYLEDTDITWNFVENVDRIYQHQEVQGIFSVSFCAYKFINL